MNIRPILGALLGAALLSGMALVGPLAREARGSFIAFNDQQITVTNVHAQGTLYHTSRALIVSGWVARLWAYDTSTVDISGGSANWLYTYDNSNVNISDGPVLYIQAHDSSTVNISGGSVDGILTAYNTSAVNISGGSVGSLYACDTSFVTFHGRDFSVHEGLWLEGDRVLGTGILTGEWADGTPWAVNIVENQAGASILAIPEPATLSLLALGGIALVRRRRVAPRKDRP
jgi:hypothetical protein